jgi:energy-converting hydrogenase Eha subunit B
MGKMSETMTHFFAFFFAMFVDHLCYPNPYNGTLGYVAVTVVILVIVITIVVPVMMVIAMAMAMMFVLIVASMTRNKVTTVVMRFFAIRFIECSFPS